MKYYFFIRLVSYKYKLQQIIKITIIHKIEKIRKKYTRCTCTTYISVLHESWWACNDVWLFDNFCQPHIINKLYKCNDLKAGFNIFVQKSCQPHIINEYKCNDSKARFNIYVKFFFHNSSIDNIFLNNIWSLFIFNNRQFCQKTHSYTHKKRIYFQKWLHDLQVS